MKTYLHNCLGCGARYLTHTLLSPAASAHMCPPGIHLAVPAYYDDWSE